jgi:hypothetical protein
MEKSTAAISSNKDIALFPASTSDKLHVDSDAAAAMSREVHFFFSVDMGSRASPRASMATPSLKISAPFVGTLIFVPVARDVIHASM